jgi:hypothetical protein
MAQTRLSLVEQHKATDHLLAGEAVLPFAGYADAAFVGGK